MKIGTGRRCRCRRSRWAAALQRLASRNKQLLRHLVCRPSAQPTAAAAPLAQPPPPHTRNRPQAVAEGLDLASCLRARLVCRSWVEGASASIISALFTPAGLARSGAAALASGLNRMRQLTSIDLSIGCHPARRGAPKDLKALMQIISASPAAAPRAAGAGDLQKGGGCGACAECARRGRGEGLSLYAYVDSLSRGRSGLAAEPPPDASAWRGAFLGAFVIPLKSGCHLLACLLACLARFSALGACAAGSAC